MDCNSEGARKLAAQVVCPGHGPRDAASLLADQQAFFKTLRERVAALVRARKTPEQVRSGVDQMKAEIAAIPQVARYVRGFGVPFITQVEKVYTEMTGKTFPAAQKTARAARDMHAHHHGLDLVG